MDKIQIHGIRTYAYHGVLEAERTIGQVFITDVALHLDLSGASTTDDLTQTVHYGEVYQLIEEVVKSGPVNLIEYLAEQITKTLFDRYDEILEMDVTITKPSPPIDGHYDSVSITLNRKREY